MKIVPILGLIGAALLASAPAKATTFDYYTEGCFGSGCTVHTSASYNSGDLEFTGQGTSAHPFVDINPTLPATINLGDLTWKGSRESHVSPSSLTLSSPHLSLERTFLMRRFLGTPLTMAMGTSPSPSPPCSNPSITGFTNYR
jgi:hypothetical protein